MSFSTDSIRTLSITGHGQTGKTSLIENFLYLAGAIDKAEPIESGKTVSDFTPEEIERKISIYSSLSHLNWNNKCVNMWDTPGSSDFIGEVISAFRTSELALMVLSAKAGIQIETVKLWRELDKRNKARIAFVNQMDDERADFDQCIKDLRTQFKVEVCPVTLPMGSGDNFKGVIDVVKNKAWVLEDNKEKEIEIPEEYLDVYKNARDVLAGAAAEGDDDLLVKFIDEGHLTDEEVVMGLNLAIKDNRIVPAFAGVAITGAGLTAALNFITEICPSPSGFEETLLNKEENEEKIEITNDGDVSALVVKTTNDQFSGKLSFIKVVTGVLKSDSELFNLSESKKERVGKLYKPLGKKIVEVKELHAGDVGVAAKLAFSKTNDTLASGADKLPFIKLQTPEPVYSMAVAASDKRDDDKLGENLVRACEEDKTLSFIFNPETRQSVLSGMGDLHINIVLGRLKNNAKIDVVTSVPRIAFRETIQKKAEAEYTHKKQSGGHGQYARVVLSIESLPRGEDYSFANAVFGGAISRGYIPGVEKGVKEAMLSGVLAGYPVVDVGTTVLDGKEHPVDSSEMAFKIAARNAFREAMKNAGPILLEPIMNLTVFVDTKNLGDIMSDLSGRRGQILGQDSIGNGIEEIRANVPHKELLKYAIELRAITSGTGSFEVSFSHYSPISGKIADDVIAQAKEFIKQGDYDD